MSRMTNAIFDVLRQRAGGRALLSVCAAGILALSLPITAAAQNGSTPNPPPQNSTPPSTDDTYRPSLLKKPATNPPAPPAPNAQTPPANAPNLPATTPPAPASAGPSGNAPAPSSAPNAAPPTAAAAGNPAARPPTAASAAPVIPSLAATPAPTDSSPAPSANSSSPFSDSNSTAPLTIPAPVLASSDPAAEMVTRTSQTPIESHVNLVPVRVIVHDAHGHAVGDLREADFEIRQDGKPQVISHFSLQTPESLEAQVARGTPGDNLEGALAPSGAPAKGAIELPTRFVAFVVDDAHLRQEDLLRMRLAAIRYVQNSVKPSERIALFTVSGQSQVDFTDDREKVIAQLKTLIRRPVGAFDPEESNDCLKMTYYQADLIQNKNDQVANDAALQDAISCATIAGVPANIAQTQASSDVASVSQQVVQAGELSTQFTIRRLDEIVRRVAAMPGQRSMVFLSPGFLTSEQEFDVLRVIDRAAQQNVFINALDARGLYTVDAIGDISRSVPVHATSATSGIALQYRTDEQRVDSEVLYDLSASTGGFYFRNNNDLDAGLLQTASEPEVSYLLAFVPAEVKNDGKFHTISVKMLTKDKYTVQARRGFFAPKHGKTPDELAKQDLEDAIFSQEEQQGLPVRLNLQYFKTDDANARLSVLTHVDVSKIHFERAEDRNTDDLTIVAALFDRNGNFIKADQKTLEMKLKDATLEKLHQNGVTVKTNFDVKPGGYLVRLVVRDARDSQIASRNGVVDIP
ncbi:MAG TPA: VWA domain-containing protein [Candidatus Acidoferrales bacterium]